MQRLIRILLPSVDQRGHHPNHQRIDYINALPYNVLRDIFKKAMEKGVDPKWLLETCPRWAKAFAQDESLVKKLLDRRIEENREAGRSYGYAIAKIQERAAFTCLSADSSLDCYQMGSYNNQGEKPTILVQNKMNDLAMAVPVSLVGQSHHIDPVYYRELSQSEQDRLSQPKSQYLRWDLVESPGIPSSDDRQYPHRLPDESIETYMERVKQYRLLTLLKPLTHWDKVAMS